MSTYFLRRQGFDAATVEIPEEYKKSGLVSKGTKPDFDGRKSFDYASYDMHIDNALALNRRKPQKTAFPKPVSRDMP